MKDTRSTNSLSSFMKGTRLTNTLVDFIEAGPLYEVEQSVVPSQFDSFSGGVSKGFKTSKDGQIILCKTMTFEDTFAYYWFAAYDSDGKFIPAKNDDERANASRLLDVIFPAVKPFGCSYVVEEQGVLRYRF